MREGNIEEESWFFFLCNREGNRGGSNSEGGTGGEDSVGKKTMSSVLETN